VRRAVSTASDGRRRGAGVSLPTLSLPAVSAAL